LSASTIDIFPAAIDFGSVNVGQTSAAVSVQVTNVGNRTLSAPRVTVSGNFIERNDCDKKLAIGKSCTIGVHFRPQASGTQTGAITIKDSALGGSQQVSLTGVGK
jgi:archaellum component FlaF (FlaF/FlaG flagellin family)